MGGGKGIFSLHAKRQRCEVDLVRGLKISGAIHPLPYTSFNGVQKDIYITLHFWIVSDSTTYSVRFIEFTDV